MTEKDFLNYLRKKGRSGDIGNYITCSILLLFGLYSMVNIKITPIVIILGLLFCLVIVYITYNTYQKYRKTIVVYSTLDITKKKELLESYINLKSWPNIRQRGCFYLVVYGTQTGEVSILIFIDEEKIMAFCGINSLDSGRFLDFGTTARAGKKLKAFILENV